MAGCDAVIHVEPFHVNPRAQWRIDVDAHMLV